MTSPGEDGVEALLGGLGVPANAERVTREGTPPTTVAPANEDDEDETGEEEPVTTAVTRPGTTGVDLDATDALGSPEDPMTAARALLREDVGTDPLGLPRTRWWRDRWWRYTGTHWTELVETALEGELYLLFEHASYWSHRPRGQALRHWAPTTSKLREVRAAFRALVSLEERQTTPGWLADETGELSRTLISTESGLVEPQTGDVLPHSRGYLTLFSLPFRFDPAAACPRWDAFLGEVFPGDPDSRLLLQEWFGYVLSGRTDLQKMMLLLGESRSGKGTVLRVLYHLLGEGTVATPTLYSFAERFGLASLVGKTLAVIGDARQGRTLDVNAVLEKLLAIVGEDAIDVDRKNQAAWSGRLPTRLMLAMNDQLWFRDRSGAVLNRMLLLHFRVSFLGREDPDLERKLVAELPGVLNWALVGLRRIEEERRFTAPGNSEGLRREVIQISDPLRHFLETRCHAGEGHAVSRQAFFTAYLAWLVAEGQPAASANLVGREMKKKGWPSGRPPGSGVFHYLGISLREPHELEEEDGG